MFTVADTVVPLGPITSNGSVTVLAEELLDPLLDVLLVLGAFGLGVRVTVAVAVWLEFATLVAVIVTVCVLLIVAGAV